MKMFHIYPTYIAIRWDLMGFGGLESPGDSVKDDQGYRVYVEEFVPEFGMRIVLLKDGIRLRTFSTMAPFTQVPYAFFGDIRYE